MKYLALLRHAKSSWKNADLDDFDRPLNNRGERDAPMMGRRLQARGLRPSLIVSSPAKRARQTVRLLAQTINYPVEFLQREAELYLAAPDTILAVISKQEDGFSNIVICGHNPGMTELANRLTDSRIDNVPTCGIVGMEADIQSWTETAEAEWRLVYFDYPKRIPENDG